MMSFKFRRRNCAGNKFSRKFSKNQIVHKNYIVDNTATFNMGAIDDIGDQQTSG